MIVWVIKRNDGTYWAGGRGDFIPIIAKAIFYGEKEIAESIRKLVLYGSDCNVVAVEIKEQKETRNEEHRPGQN